MKMIYVFMFLFMLSSVSAVEISDACASRNFTNTLGVWSWNSGWFAVGNTYVDVVGDARKINWTSSINIDGVVYKSGTRTYLSDGGFNGTIPKTTLSNDFSWVVFCGNTPAEIPEFGIIAGIIALVACILIYRRK